MESFIYKTAGDCPIRLDVYPGATSPAPVVVWIHGGALIAGSRRGINRLLCELLAEKGYAQVSIDYRLAPEAKLPDIIEDVRDAFAWVHTEGRTRFGFDSNRLGVIGNSAGGYLTLMSGFAVRPRPNALVSFYGYGDIAGNWYSEPDPFYCRSPRVTPEEAYAGVGEGMLSEADSAQARFRYYLYCRQNGLWPKELAGIDPHEHPEAFIPYCPVRNVTKEYPPTLLLHGDGDTDVPYQLSVDMAAALTVEGVENELITIPGGPHGFDYSVTRESLAAEEPTPAAASIKTVLGFLARHI